MEYRKRGKAERQWDAEGVRALRDHLGLTQQQMSEEMGTRQQTISEWERGMYRPRGVSRTMLNIIADRAGFGYKAEPSEESDESDEETVTG